MKFKRKDTTFFTKVKTKEEDEENNEGISPASQDTSYTFIGANTLPDRAGEILPDGTTIVGEILSKNVLDKFAGYINDSSKLGGDYGSYRTISLFHNRVHERDYSLEEAGYVKPNSARVEELKDYPGNFGLFVDVEVNKMYNPPENYADYTPDKITYKIEKGNVGLSLEYNNRSDQERIVEVSGSKYRYIMDSDDFRGFGFARADLIGNPAAVRVKEINLSKTIQGQSIKKGENQMTDEAKTKELEQLQAELVKSQAKVKELEEEKKEAEKEGEEAKAKEINTKLDAALAKVKEMELKADADAVKIKESIERAFSNVNLGQAPAKTKEGSANAKIKEAYDAVEQKDFVKLKETSDAMLEADSAKFKETIGRSGMGFDFEKHQTLKVKCVGGGSGKMVVVPSAKTKDVIDASDMAEGTYNQTNAMFADRYVAGISETFLREDSLLTAVPKESHIGGNDKYQWRIWTEYETVTGDSTLSVNPNVTSVARTQRNFEKLETRIVEYRDGVEVTDFAQHHSMAAVGDLLGLELERAAQAVTESMNADLFKPKTDATSGWNGFIGLIGVADSGTYTSLYGKTRSAANRLLDATTANTYDSTSEAISVSVIRAGYEKVLAHGSSLGSLAIAMHPSQMRKLWDTEDAAIRNNILSMEGAPASFGFNRAVVPHVDGIPVIRDYRCESSAAAADMFVVIDLSPDKGLSLVVSKPLGARGLAKVGTSESAYVSFWGAAVYKSPRNVFLHDSLT